MQGNTTISTHDILAGEDQASLSVEAQTAPLARIRAEVPWVARILTQVDLLAGEAERTNLVAAGARILLAVVVGRRSSEHQVAARMDLAGEATACS